MIGEAEMNRLRRQTRFSKLDRDRLREHWEKLSDELRQFVSIPKRTYPNDNEIIYLIDSLRANLEPFIPTVYPVDDPRACKGAISGITR